MPHQFRHLFTPFRVGNLTLNNRIVSTGHAEAMAEDGKPGPRLRAYHEAKARGGAALTIIGGSTSVHPSSPASAWNMIANHDDAIVPAYRAIAEAVHRHGCRIMTQLTHLGRRSQSDVESWHVLLAPSQIPEKVHREVPHEIEPEQIAMLVGAFGDGARRCREGGLDGVELSFAHNHLVDQFWSPLFNRRTDDYGGSLENRMRFGFEVLREVRRRVGRDWVVGVRISGDEMTDGGLTAEDMAEIARRLAASSLVDFLSVIGGAAHTASLQARVVPNMAHPVGLYVPLAAAIKRAAPGMPILHASRIVDPLHADRVLAEGAIDLVGMTRALIADPELPRKAQEGRFEDIRVCVGANEGCIDRIYQGKPVTCVQNPGASREAELAEPARAAAPRRVMVIGAGVAGLEAARVAALRGHRVVLIEREDEVGGQVLVAARAPARAEYAGIVHFLARQVDKLGVDRRLGVEATVETVLAGSPDVVIVATGSHPHRPSLPGLDGKHVVTDRDVLLDRVAVGDRVVLVDDVHTQQGLSTAECLLERGRQVEVVSRLDHPGQDVGVTSIVPLYTRLFARGVTLTPHTDLVAVEGSTVVVANTYTGAQRRIEGVDTVVLSMGSRSTDALYRALKGQVPTLHAIGDCVAPRGVHHAILEGARAGRAA
ncbi:MAG TPA: FAD-dependent oxidoreductase [Methylomirabilota bacterium]|jgi:mycofactocin system FadH/OYE family oxidoreductase 2|nr:FAD-dependent oxidoreductase [Methylomirabilota bacterium]